MERRWKVLAVTATAAFMGFLDVTIVNIAFPSIADSFGGSSLGDLSWVLNGYNVVFAALLVPAGRLADRVGRRRLFLWGLAGFVAASALCGLAWSVPALVTARVLQAAAGAALVPTSLSLLLPEFPRELRATATSLWGASGAVAAAVGPSLGGLLVDWTGWRAVFFVNLAVGVPALLIAPGLLRETRDETGRLPDVAGTALLAAGVALLALGIVKAPDWGWTSARVLGSFAAAAVVLAACALRSSRHPAPVLELSLLRSRSLAVASASTVAFSIAFYGMLLANVLYLTGTWGYSTLRAGVALTPGPLMATVGAMLAGRLSDRYGQRVVAVPGAAIFTAGAVALVLLAQHQPAYASRFLPAILLTGLGVGLSFASLASAAVSELPPARYATGSALVACGRQIGAVLGIALVVAILQAAAPGGFVGAYRDAFWLIAACGGATALAAAGLGRVRPRQGALVGSPAVEQATPTA